MMFPSDCALFQKKNRMKKDAQFLLLSLIGAHTVLADCSGLEASNWNIEGEKWSLLFLWFHYKAPACETFWRFRILNWRYFTKLFHQMVSSRPPSSILRSITSLMPLLPEQPTCEATISLAPITSAERLFSEVEISPTKSNTMRL